MADATATPDASSAPAIGTTFQDIDGNYSSKRILGFVFAAVLIAAICVDTFTVHKVSELWANCLMYLIAASMGLACAERFAPRASNPPA